MIGLLVGNTATMPCAMAQGVFFGENSSIFSEKQALAVPVPIHHISLFFSRLLVAIQMIVLLKVVDFQELKHTLPVFENEK